jgi:hypothetical protein
MPTRLPPRLVRGVFVMAMAAATLEGFSLVILEAQTAAQMGSEQRPPPISVYSLEPQLQRQGVNGCASAGLGRITLDGSGRFVDLAATATQPAYWPSNVASIDIENTPYSPAVAETSDDLVLEPEVTERVPVPLPATEVPQWRVPANGHLSIRRDLITSLNTRALVKVAVKRQNLVIGTLWFIMRNRNVILLNADGPVDPDFRSSVAPAYVF